jgi:phytanoyl-CoA hydroxylase
MRTEISSQEWQTFARDGYLRLGQVASDEELHGLQTRMDDIMLGRADVDYERMMMQLDRADGPDSQPGPQSYGFKGATLAYRKIQDLEYDALFLAYLQKPLFANICAQVYGDDRRIACMRAMFMNKPAGFGTHLVWHQDRWTNLDRDPQITLWTALDPATIENGCVHVIPGSHGALVNPEHGSGFLTAEQTEKILAENEPVPLELEAGEVVLLHNWLLHSSDVNRSGTPRRAFSVCYMDAETVANNGHVYPVVFGAGALS